MLLVVLSATVAKFATTEALRSQYFDGWGPACTPPSAAGTGYPIPCTCVQNVREVFKVKNDIMRPLICSRIKGKANLWLLSKTSLLSSDIDDMLMQLKTIMGFLQQL
ncbi:hypothetical protein ACLKA7_011833 [Drosophila subpalustris]